MVGHKFSKFVENMVKYIYVHTDTYLNTFISKSFHGNVVAWTSLLSLYPCMMLPDRVNFFTYD